MAYKAWAVSGTVLKRSAASPVNYQAIRGVTNLTGPTASKPDIDVTAIDDTASQFIAGTPDYGNVSFDLFWDHSEAQHLGLYNDFNIVGSITYFEITCSNDDATVGTFQGEVKGWEHDFSSANQAAKVKVTVKLSGPISWIL